MKAITVLIVLLLSTPAYACDTYLNTANQLAKLGFHYVTSHKNYAIFEDNKNDWIGIELDNGLACVVEGGMTI